jgi:uncharacterized membrane protein
MSARTLAVIGAVLLLVAVVNVPSIVLEDPIDPAVQFVGSTVPFWAGVIALAVAVTRRKTR